jgi:hypothetical protein
MHGEAIAYSSEAFNANYLEVVENEAFAEGTEEVWNILSSKSGHSHRKLGITKGNVGSVVSATLIASPQFMELGEDTDAVFAVLREALIRRVERNVFAGVLRDEARGRGCAALAGTADAQLVYISSDYYSTVLNSVVPTSMPSLHPRVESSHNRAGVLAGLIVGLTAALMCVMAGAFYKDDVAATLGLAFLLEREDNFKEAPEVVQPTGGREIAVLA